MKEPFIYMPDDASEEEVSDMDMWLWCRRFEAHNAGEDIEKGWGL
jgi:hypothetical protein